MPQVPPTLPTSAPTETSPSDTNMDSATPSDLQAEIPYVPASMRQKPIAIMEDDSIVVVGKTKQKKRKRVPRDTPLASSTPGSAGEETKEAESFDFASASNVLDEGSDHEVIGDTRKKRPKGKGQGIISKSYFDVDLSNLSFSQFLWGLPSTAEST